MCSVLFADLVGFTPLSETRDPEEVRELLSAYFDRARTVIGRYGGVVEKFIGDAVMAVWGTPVATEGDAERAVRAALDVVAAVAELGEEVGAPDLAARAGVVTGEVAVTVGLGGEGVAGDAVNTAARVQSVAAPGAVWVDAATYRLAGAAIGFADTGEHELKGKSEPVRLWAATRVLSGVGGSQRTDGLEAPLLGPRRRAADGQGAVPRLRRTTRPRLVVVSGPAGVGKSRLGWEFEKYVDGLADTIYWHRGRCLSYGEGVVFWALTEIVRQRLGIAEEDPAETAAAKLAEGLETFVPDQAERAYIGPRLGRLLGVTWPVTRGHPGPRGAVRRMEGVLRAAGRDPTGGAADRGRPVRRRRAARLRGPPGRLGPGLAHLRAGVHPPRARLSPGPGSAAAATARRSRSTRSTTRRWTPSSTPWYRTCPRRHAPPSPSQAEGIPLFAVETVRSLVDRDIVVPRDGVYRLVGDLGDLSVPDGLRALLAARLDALDPDLRSLVAEAAVSGLHLPRRFARGRVRPRRGVGAGRAWPSCCAERCCPSAPTGSRPNAGTTASPRTCCARWPTRPCRAGTARPDISPWPPTCEPCSGPTGTRWPRSSRGTISMRSPRCPTPPMLADIRAQAIDMLVRAAERALRAGAASGGRFQLRQRRAADRARRGVAPTTTRSVGAAGLWERAARAALTAFDVDGTLAYSRRASELYAAHGQARAAARVRGHRR